MKSHFFHLIATLVICVVVLFGYGLWYSAISAKSAAVANLQSQIEEKIETMSRVASAHLALAEISGAQSSLRNYFVPETGVVSFIDGLEAHGEALGTTVRILSVSKGSNLGQPSLIFSISIKGTFDAVVRTVGAIEYAPYNLSISQFSLARDGKNIWQADFNLIVGSIGAAISTSL